jgi:outer membrane receptor for monomeric catechols
VFRPQSFVTGLNSTPMQTTPRFRLRISAALAATALSGGLFAQVPASSPLDSSDPIVLQPFSVTAEKSSGYKVSSASTATRTNTAIIDIPQTVDIVTKEFWNDIGATTFDQSFRYIANAFTRNRHAGNGDGVSLRGFETSGSIFVDGVRMGNNKRDLVGYERLEVVKGPPSAVQGRAGGTGLLNYILKKPELGVNSVWGKYSYSFDGYDAYMNRLEFDANLAVPGGRDMAARVAGSWQNGEDYIQFQRIENYTLYPSFKWQITPRTDLVFNAELQKLNTPSREEGHGFAVYPEKMRRLIPRFNTPNDPITSLGLPYNFNISGPGNQDKNTIANATLFLTHQFNDWLYFRQVGNMRYVGYDQYWYTGEDNTKTVVNSQYQGSVGFRRGATAQGDLIAKYAVRDLFTGFTMVGYGYDDGSSEDSFYNGVPNAPFNTLDMAAIKAAGYRSSFYNNRTVTNLPRARFTENDSYSFGIFAQQDLGFFNNRLLLSGGLRRDKDVTETRSKLTGLRTAGADTSLDSYRYGATFKLRPQLALYAVKSVQNDVPSTVARYNGLIAGDPRLSEFFTVTPQTELEEAGIKGEAFDGRLSFTVTYWKMTKTGSVVNILSNGVSQGQNVTFGTVSEIQGAESKGWELTAYGSITSRLSLIANFTDLNTSQGFTGQQNTAGWSVANNNPGRIPLRFAPEWNGNLFAKYSFRNAQEQGWEVKGGVSMVGPLYTQLTGFGLTRIPETQRSYDAGVAYRWNRYNFDVMVTNLTNEPFYITRDQPPRTYRFSVAAQF